MFKIYSMGTKSPGSMGPMGANRYIWAAESGFKHTFSSHTGITGHGSCAVRTLNHSFTIAAAISVGVAF